MKRTYEAGRQQFDNLSSIGGSEGRLSHQETIKSVRRRGSSLGVFRGCGSSYSLNREAIQQALMNKTKMNKSCQTVLSFPSPSKNNLYKTIDKMRMKFLPRSLSIDDVMKLVDTEEGDILLLTELTKEESGLTTSSTNSEDVSETQVVISKSFDTNFNPSSFMDAGKVKKISTMSAPVESKSKDSDSELVETFSINIPPHLRPTPFTLQELEAREEEEDRLALGALALDNTVHFRSR